MASRTPIVIYQGDTSHGQISYPGAAVGDTAVGQISAWPGGLRFAALSCDVDVVAKVVHWRINSNESAAMVRNGYYDIQVNSVSGVETIAYGPAVLRPQVTITELLGWGSFDEMTWGEFDVLTQGAF